MSVKFRVVLVEPSRSWNIGSVARVMNNMDVETLYLVNPCDHLHHKAFALAVNSHYILHRALVVTELSKAIGDCELTIAFTARERFHQNNFNSSRELSQIVKSNEGIRKCALIFGREDSGLTNQEMSQCNQFMHIPAPGKSKSLNLSQAVMIALYELNKFRFAESEQKFESQRESDLATQAERNNLKTHILNTLENSRFRENAGGDFLNLSLARLINNYNFTSKDIRFLHAIFRHLNQRP